jgi:hypothetical protein
MAKQTRIPCSGVICDWCSTDYTGKDTQGGMIFAGYAVCAACEIKAEIPPDEMKFIKELPLPGESFYEMVLRYRESRCQKEEIVITSYDTADEMLEALG